MLARYGEARAEPGDTEDAMLEVERFDRRLEPSPVTDDCEVETKYRPASVETGVSKMVGVSFNRGPVACSGVGTLVWIYNPALAGEDRWASGGCWIDVSSVCNVAAF